MGQLDTHIRVKLVSSSVAKPGKIVFTSSSVFTVPKGINEVQVFVVGGGGSSGYGRFSSSFAYGGGGGGGGYTKTAKISTSEYKSLEVVIGAGGPFTSQENSGGATSVESISAPGGIHASASTGGSGGSGGGAYSDVGILYWYPGGSGGSDGGNGGRNGMFSTPGNGQGTTTRAFGDSDGTLYSYGGYGGSQTGSPSNASSNTGNGAPGGIWTGNGYMGGSGIAIIRWGY